MSSPIVQHENCQPQGQGSQAGLNKCKKQSPKTIKHWVSLHCQCPLGHSPSLLMGFSQTPPKSSSQPHSPYTNLCLPLLHPILTCVHHLSHFVFLFSHCAPPLNQPRNRKCSKLTAFPHCHTSLKKPGRQTKVEAITSNMMFSGVSLSYFTYLDCNSLGSQTLNSTISVDLWLLLKYKWEGILCRDWYTR